MGAFAKKIRRKTRIEYLQSQVSSLTGLLDRISIRGARMKKTLEEFSKGENWGQDDSGVPFWLGEGSPEELAKEALKKEIRHVEPP